MSETERKKIAANVVTYNRKQLLGECLNALLHQTYPLDAIYIIDNASTDGTPEYLMDKGLIDNILYPDKEPMEATKVIQLPPFPDKKVDIHYVRMPENTGSSGGQYEGVKRGYEKGYDWLWLMDDDAEPMSDCLEILLKECKENNLLAVCPLIYGVKTSSVQFYHHKFLHKGLFIKEQKVEEFQNLLEKRTVRLDANAFVGPLIHRNIISDVGFPNKDYFIWVDDKEYTYRISRKYSLYLVPKAVIKHKDENISSKSDRIPVSIYWKQYYGIRNGIFFESTYNNWLTAFLMGLYILIRRSLGIVYYGEDKKIYRLKVIFRGVIDGLRGRMGRNEKVLLRNDAKSC